MNIPKLFISIYIPPGKNAKILTPLLPLLQPLSLLPSPLPFWYFCSYRARLTYSHRHCLRKHPPCYRGYHYYCCRNHYNYYITSELFTQLFVIITNVITIIFVMVNHYRRNSTCNCTHWHHLWLAKSD